MIQTNLTKLGFIAVLTLSVTLQPSLKYVQSWHEQTHHNVAACSNKTLHVSKQDRSPQVACTGPAVFFAVAILASSQASISLGLAV